jgi:hypothetical protein
MTEDAQQESNLTAVMSPVNRGMVQQLAHPHGALLSAPNLELNDAKQVLVLQSTEKRPHVAFDLAPGYDDRLEIREVVSV